MSDGPISDGGPAFPVVPLPPDFQSTADQWYERRGMTLRDFFAAHALMGLSQQDISVKETASLAYQLADAMIKAREGSSVEPLPPPKYVAQCDKCKQGFIFMPKKQEHDAMRRAEVQRNHQEDCKMTQEKKRIKIAEACGWTNDGNYWIRPDGIRTCQCAYPEILTASTPDYFSDLNAMHEAERWAYEKQPPGWSMSYNENLRLVTAQSKDPLEYNWAWHANAAQRAEAFGLTLNLWNPED